MADNKPDYGIRSFHLSSYVKPNLVEYRTRGRDYVLNGRYNSFFDYIDDRYNGSSTNSAIIDSYADRMYGKGLSIINSKTHAGDYAAVLNTLPAKEVRKVVFDFVKYGSSVLQIRYGKGARRKVAIAEHLERKTVAPSKYDKDGKIPSYWYCQDWRKPSVHKPKEFPTFKTSGKNIEIMEIRPYQSGRDYFADPPYLAGLQYAHLEEEIANFSINHIQNGLSAGMVLNFNNGVPPQEVQDEIERKVINKTTGSSNAARIVFSFNDSSESGVKPEPFPNSADHEQWQFWANEARQQVMVAHRVTSPILFGVKDNTGLGNNANEIIEASKLLDRTVISPKRIPIIEAFQEIVGFNGISSPITFLPLDSEETDDNDDDEKEANDVELESHEIKGVDLLIGLGGDYMDEEWEITEEREVEGHSIDEERLNAVFHLASTPIGDARKSSEQDTSLFKIRYVYAGNPDPEREFCRKLMKANKVYRYEDLKAAEDLIVNEGFGKGGDDRYSIFLYKGGVNCKHWWKRVIYLKKNNRKISVNRARQLILKLDPISRKDAKWNKNPKEVAQIASDENNYWRVN